MRILQMLAPCVTAVLLVQSSGLSQNAPEAVEISGTMLRVVLPTGWQLDKGVNPSQLSVLTNNSTPRYQLSVSQTTPRTTRHSCMNLIGSLQAVGGPGSTVVSRPSFVPDVYFGSFLSAGNAQLTCLSSGASEVSVMIQAMEANAKPEVLTPILAAIADAALKQSGVVSNPGPLNLPVLGIEIPVRRNAWGVRSETDAWGTHDVLGRASEPGSNELFISPFIFQAQGRCEVLAAASSFALATRNATLVKGRRLGGDSWFPDVWEQFPQPFKSLQAFACKNAGANSILLARIEYEKATISNADLIVIREILDNVGDAVDRKFAGNASNQVSEPAPTGDSIGILSDTQGYDLSNYLASVTSRLRSNWFSVMPEIARRGERGRTLVRFTIARDGRVENWQVAETSGNVVLDRGAMAAIQISSPFAPLPADFKGSSIVIQFPFLYNLQPQERN